MKIHMVKKGDTLYFIAKKYNVSLEELIQANPGIANPDEIDVGMKVKIPMPSKPAVEMMHHHTVQQGDTLWKLSKAWGIPLSDLIKANPQLKNPNVLLTGEVVHIPKPPVHGSELMPQATSTFPASDIIPGKKHTGMMPESVVLPEPPAYPMPAPQQISEVQEAPAPVKKETAPAAKQPYPEQKQLHPEQKHPYPEQKHAYPDHKHPYPEHKHPYPHEGHHHLFAQFPFPAMEATALAGDKNDQTDYGMMHYPAMHFAQPTSTGHEYGAQGHAGHGGHGQGYGYGYGYGDMSSGMPSGVQGAAGSMYHPADLSGYGAKADGYGDMPHTEAATAPQMTGYMPGHVAPTAAYPHVYGMHHPHGGCGCGCGGGMMAMPAMGGYGWPAGAFMPAYAMNPWSPFTYPAMAAQGDGGGYGRTGEGAGANAAGSYDSAPSASLPAVPDQDQAQTQSAKDGEPPLSLHHVDEDKAAASASSNKKRAGAGKPKRHTRKAKPQRKQNLPWIR